MDILEPGAGDQTAAAAAAAAAGSSMDILEPGAGDQTAADDVVMASAATQRACHHALLPRNYPTAKVTKKRGAKKQPKSVDKAQQSITGYLKKK